MSKTWKSCTMLPYKLTIYSLDSTILLLRLGWLPLITLDLFEGNTQRPVESTWNSAIYGTIKHVPHTCLLSLICRNKRNHLKMSIKLRIINVPYSFLHLYDAGYVGFTRRHLHQLVQEHRKSTPSIGKHFRNKHSLAPRDLTKNFSVWKKSTNKFDCLIYEMFTIQELRPALNVQSDSIRAKVFN